jgi:hypothetical protein
MCRTVVVYSMYNMYISHFWTNILLIYTTYSGIVNYYSICLVLTNLAKKLVPRVLNRGYFQLCQEP